MKINSEIKELLLQYCSKNILDKVTLIENNLASIIESRNNETKSSVGDKFETGRARLQSEIDRYTIQLSKTRQLKNELMQIELNKKHTKVALGSLLITSNGNYFLSIGFGKIEVLENSYYAISLASPVGQLFKDKTVGADLQHLNNSYEILELI